MQLKIGSYPFLANACDIQARFVTLKNKGGQPYASRQALDVTGFLQGTGQADITAKMNALASALATPYQDIVFYQDDGITPAATALYNNPSISGVIVTRGPEFKKNQGGEYSNYRTFEFTAEAEYPLAGSQDLLLDFRERIVATGGLPLRTIMLAVAGPHQEQIIYEQLPFELTQEGLADALPVANRRQARSRERQSRQDAARLSGI